MIAVPVERERESTFALAQRQFDLAADMLDLDCGMRQMLRVPQRELTVKLPVRTPTASRRGSLWKARMDRQHRRPMKCSTIAGFSWCRIFSPTPVV